MPSLSKLPFGKFLDEFGDAAAPALRKVMAALGANADDKVVRAAIRREGYEPIKGLADNPASRAIEQAAAPVARSKAPRAKVSVEPPRDTFTVTPEATPGLNTGHRSDIQSAPFSVREDYQRDASFLRDGDDILYSALGVPQRTQRGIGAYINSANTLETNPVDVTGIDFSNIDRDTILAIEKMRGVIDAQEAMAGNMPIADAAGNARYFGMGRPPSADEMKLFERNVPGGFGATPTTDGALVFPFNSSEMTGEKAGELLGPLIDQVPNYQAVPVRNDMGFYEPAMGRFDDNFNIVPSPAFSGEATMDMLEAFSRAPQSVLDTLSTTPEFKDILKQKYLRDAGAPTTREDIQNTRMLLADPKFAEAVKLIRQGVSPAAALAAIGYSTSALAASTRE